MVRVTRKASRILKDGFVLFAVLLFIIYTLPASEDSGSASLRKIQKLKGVINTARHQASPHRLLRRSRSSSSPPSSHRSHPFLSVRLHDTQICPTCNASSLGDFAVSPYFSGTPVLARDEVRATILSGTGHSLIKRYLVQNIPLAATISKAWMWDKSQNIMLNSYLSSPDSLLSYNFEGLKLDLPTSYIYTRTGGSKLDIERRIKYFRMHHETVKAFQEKVQQQGYFDGAKHEERQLVYIVVRDDSHIDPEVDALFKASSIPYLYFAIGPTKDHGIAQWNAVERAIETIRDTFFGDGPVLNIDDDARILPELLDRMWRVKRIVAWPAGNMHPGGWEGLMCENGVQNHWRLGWIPERVFPLDMQAFAINSSEIGEGRSVAGPKYIRFAGRGGESAFLEQISQKREEAECLCDNTLEEGCFYSWHNWGDSPGYHNSPPLTTEAYHAFFTKQKKALQAKAMAKARLQTQQAEEVDMQGPELKL